MFVQMLNNVEQYFCWWLVLLVYNILTILIRQDNIENVSYVTFDPDTHEKVSNGTFVGLFYVFVPTDGFCQIFPTLCWNFPKTHMFTFIVFPNLLT